MPYRMIWESNAAIWTKFSGFLTAGEAERATSAFYHDPRSDGVARAFWDFSDIDGFAVGESDVEELAGTNHAASLYMKPMKAAFIVRDPELMIFVEQYIAHMRDLGSRWQNRVFSSIDDARQWAASVP